MKKMISIFVITALIVGMTSITAFAHGGHGSGIHRQSRYELCTVSGCDAVGPHQHDGSWYCGQTGRRGDYEICTVKGCAQQGLHEHNGTYYYRANRGAKHGCWRATEPVK